MERLACEEIDGLLRDDATILDLDVAYLGSDLPENNGIEGSVHSTEGAPPAITTSAIASVFVIKASGADALLTSALQHALSENPAKVGAAVAANVLGHDRSWDECERLYG